MKRMTDTLKHKIAQIKHELAYVLAFLLSNSKVQPTTEKAIECLSDDVKYYADTPNTIIYFKKENNEGYFRECRLHTGKRAYLECLLEDYCKYVYTNEHSDECLALLKEKLENKKNFVKFFYMGAGTAKYTRITKFRSTGNSSFIGIEGPYPKWFYDQLLQLVQYAWGPLDEYRYNSYLKLASYNTYNANRTITTKLVADMIGAPHIVPKSEYTVLMLDGVKKVGVVVEPAKGKSPQEALIDGMRKVNPEFQRQLSILHLADVICYQKDHRPGNYFVSLNDDGEAVEISAFDNDCPTTLMCTTDIQFKTYIGCAPMVTHEGYINLPFLDCDVVNKILQLKPHNIKKFLQGHLSNIELSCLIKRVIKLQLAITKSVDSGKTVLLSKNEWNERTVAKELSGEFGLTYLKLFVDKYLNSERSE